MRTLPHAAALAAPLWTRRGVLGAAGALAALPASAAEDEREALIAHVRACSVGFDLAAFARRVMEDGRLPERWIRATEAVFEGVEHLRGLRSFAELDRDEGFGGRMAELRRRAERSLALKLAALRLAHDAPRDEDEARAMVEHVHTRWFGLDLQRLRAHTATYADEGLLVVYGPGKSLVEVLYAAGREPFTRYLELVHARRAREWVFGRDDLRALLEALLDPSVRVVAWVGHGTWTAFSLYGWRVDPEVGLLKVCRRLRDEPREAVPALLADDTRSFALGGMSWGALEEAQLAELVRQWAPSEARGALLKELVVRHTCGTGRYETDGELIWELLPAELREQVYVKSNEISGRRPGLDGTWEPALAAWLEGRQVALTERTAFGTCLVADPTFTRGYAGLSWMPDFVEDPIPAWSAPHPWPTTEVSE